MRRVMAVAFAVVVAMAGGVRGQTQTSSGGAVGGVAITTEGLLQIPRVNLPAARPVGAAAKKDAGLIYISLSKLLADAQALSDAGKPLSADIRYLHGLTQIQYLFAYPAEHDLVIAGKAEGVRADNTLEPVGTQTGRPVVQFDDLAVAFRGVYGGGRDGEHGRDFFGCSIDPLPGDAETAAALAAKYGTDHARLIAELKKAVGVQQVKIFGVPEDSRVGLVMVAADYRLKRLGMGLDNVPGLGTGLGMDGAARMWFRPSYDALVVSGGSYAIAGSRLMVAVDEGHDEPGPVPPTIARFTKQFSEKMPVVASQVAAVADLQNVTDLFLVAALVRQDELAVKTGVDLTWLLDEQKCKVAKVTVPRTAETLLSINGNQLARGGVAIASRGLRRMPRGEGDGVAVLAMRRRPAGEWFEVR